MFGGKRGRPINSGRHEGVSSRFGWSGCYRGLMWSSTKGALISTSLLIHGSMRYRVGVFPAQE